MKAFRITQVYKQESRCSACGSMFITLSLKSGKRALVQLPNDMKDTLEMMEDCDVGDKFMIEVVSMSEEEITALPEFSGF